MFKEIKMRRGWGMFSNILEILDDFDSDKSEVPEAKLGARLKDYTNAVLLDICNSEVRFGG